MTPMFILPAKEIGELSLLERSRIYRNSQINGMMRQLLAGEGKGPAFIICGSVDPEGKNIIAWSYLYDSKMIIGYTEIGVFVNPRYRRKGYGKRIIEAAVDYHKNSELPPTLISRPWNLAGAKFFTNAGIERQTFPWIKK